MNCTKFHQRFSFCECEALFGSISALGGTWTVTFRAREQTDRHSSISGSHTGYGDFPFDRFPGLPVIDYRTVEDWNAGILSVYCSDAYAAAVPPDSLPLEQYLKHQRDHGAMIIRQLFICGATYF